MRFLQFHYEFYVFTIFLLEISADGCFPSPLAGYLLSPCLVLKLHYFTIQFPPFHCFNPSTAHHSLFSLSAPPPNQPQRTSFKNFKVLFKGQDSQQMLQIFFLYHLLLFQFSKMICVCLVMFWSPKPTDTEI